MVVLCDDDRERATDSLNAIKWSCKWSNYVLIVDLSPQGWGWTPKEEGFVVMRPPVLRAWQDGFWQLWALHQAFEEDRICGQAIGLDRHALLINRGLDEWMGAFIKNGTGVLGVEDRLSYHESYSACAELLSAWDVPHELWEDPPSSRTIHPAIYSLAGGLVRDLFHRGLLPPLGCEDWPVPFGPFITWVPQMLNYTVEWIGSMDRPAPALYVNQLRSAQAPPPQILDGGFRAYYSLQCISGYTQRAIRRAYQQMRDA